MLSKELSQFRGARAISWCAIGAVGEFSARTGCSLRLRSGSAQAGLFYVNSYERSAAAGLFDCYLESNPMPQVLFTTSHHIVLLPQGVMDVTLKRGGPAADSSGYRHVR
ncbi:MAG: Catabolite repressor/activator [Sodalis sp.]|nr:MAG: Catabolite repressor/activator [Sodalis sp.]